MKIREVLSEGYMLRLERDKRSDMLVLHIKDTKTGRRSEVRGKPGYETNEYDSNDKLHQVLDKVGKTANISELMNGEVVGINPRHPQAKMAIDTVSKIINEVNIDNKNGRGAVPNNQDVDYFGMRVKMKPSVFISLAAKLGREPNDEMIDYIKKGGAIGSPFLIVSVDGDKEPATIIGHEGRNRMLAIIKAEGDTPIEVHLFFNSNTVNKARHLTPEIIEFINSQMISEDGNLVSGPLFTV